MLLGLLAVVIITLTQKYLYVYFCIVLNIQKPWRHDAHGLCLILASVVVKIKSNLLLAILDNIAQYLKIKIYIFVNVEIFKVQMISS